MTFKKLKRTWSHNDLNYIPNFRETFPELKHLSTEELCDRFIRMKMNFFYQETTPVKWWVRLTLPLALIFIVLMFLGLPFNFLIKGEWGYHPIGKKGFIVNWFRALKLT